MITPKDMQVCYVKMKATPDVIDIAIWDTSYSIFGAGGHFRFGDGSQAGLPVDVDRWAGTHWIATETPNTAIEWTSPNVATETS